MYNEKNNTKKHKIPKKIEIRVGAWPTHQRRPTSEFFLDFWNFFNLTKPLSYVIIKFKF